MKKILIVTLLCFSLISCNRNKSTTSSSSSSIESVSSLIVTSENCASSLTSIDSSEINSSFEVSEESSNEISSEENSSIDSISSSSIANTSSNSSFSTPSVSSSTASSISSSTASSSSSSTTSSTNSSSASSSGFSSSDYTSSSSSSSSSISSTTTSSIIDKKEEYNPDGTVKLPIPTSSLNSKWGQSGKFYEIDSSFPDGFSCIYGKQIIDTPPYYSTGSWKITYPNTGTRLGFQSPLFEEDLKLEVWFTVSEIHRNNDTLDKTNPWIRIYGYSADGKLIRTKDIESPSKFSERDYHYAFNGEGINYFELRFMAQPYEGSKCYNYGISKIGVKSFPYAYND